MAKFMDAPSLMKMDIGGLKLEKQPQLKDIELGEERKVEFDFGKELEKMAKTRGDTKNELPGLALSEIDLGISGLATVADLKTLSPEEQYLQEAKSFIKQEKFKQAIIPLGKLLDEVPTHHEALYLKAVCQVNVGAEMNALNTLYPLQNANLDHKIESRIHALKEKIRARIQAKLFVELLLIGHSKLASRLHELIKLDPEFEFYYFLLTLIFMQQHMVIEAYECVESGLRNITGRDSERLSNLKEHIEKRLIEVLLAPAIKSFKTGAYGRAHKILLKIDNKFKTRKEYTLFDAYLKKLGGGVFSFFGKKEPSKVGMKGSFKDVERLQSIIVKEEISQAHQHIGRGNLDRAEKFLTQALRYFPEYPYANFLLAGCKYKKTTILFFTGNLRDIDQAIHEMEGARKFARLGEKDPGIAHANDLTNQIDVALSFFTAMNEEIKRRQKEIKLVNGLIEEFVGIMQNAEKGIGSIKEFNDIFSRMKNLKTRLKDTKRGVTSPDGRETLGQLEVAIDRNLEALKSMEKSIEEQRRDVDVVNEAGKKYQDIMGSIKGGISSESQADKIDKQLRNLKKNFSSYYRKVKSKSAKEALSQLEHSIDQGLKQLAEVRSSLKHSLKDKEIVERNIKDFNSMMSSLNSKNAIRSRSDLDYYINKCENLAKQIGTDSQKLHSQEAKNALMDLAKSIANVYNQLKQVG